MRKWFISGSNKLERDKLSVVGTLLNKALQFWGFRPEFGRHIMTTFLEKGIRQECLEDLGVEPLRQAVASRCQT
jgi:hypothetical protein